VFESNLVPFDIRLFVAEVVMEKNLNQRSGAANQVKRFEKDGGSVK